MNDYNYVRRGFRISLSCRANSLLIPEPTPIWGFKEPTAFVTGMRDPVSRREGWGNAHTDYIRNPQSRKQPYGISDCGQGMPLIGMKLAKFQIVHQRGDRSSKQEGLYPSKHDYYRDIDGRTKISEC